MLDLLFDGNSLWARAFYASQRAEKSTEFDDGMPPEKLPTPVELGVKMVLGVIDPYSGKLNKKIGRMLFCWDGKAKREKLRQHPHPPGYDEQMLQFKEVLKALFGVANVTPPEHEADDAVATAAYRATLPTVVLSGDKDLQQLVGPQVSYYCLNKGMLLTRAEILERWHVKRPIQICLALAILGDPGDNVPGVYGWGPKRVETLFEKIHGDMDLEQALEVVYAKLPVEHHAVFNESLELTILDPEVPGVPEPMPLVFASLVMVRELGMKELVGRFAQVRDTYMVDEGVIDELIDQA
jgi:5'-3' exonuclease